jgi:hypothetical protein
MLPPPAFYLLTLNTNVHIHWSARAAVFVHEWQRRLQTATVSGPQAGDHVLEAASLVMSAVEQLDDHTAQVLRDIYRLSGQLPAVTERFFVGLLELRVEERHFVMSRQEGVEHLAITYYFDIVRYRYETIHALSFATADSF